MGLKDPEKRCYAQKVWSSKELLYRVDPGRVHDLRFLLEACDGLAQLTTLDPGSGLVRVLVPPGREAEFDQFLGHVRHKLFVEQVKRENT